MVTDQPRNRLQHHRTGLGHGRPHGQRRRHLEADLVGVHRVRLAVVHRDGDVDDRIAVDASGGERLEHALLHGGDVLPGNGTPHHLVPEVEALAPAERFQAQMADPELPVAARLLLVLPFGVGRPRDRLPVRDAQLLAFDVHIALATQPLERHGQVHLAADAEDGLMRLVVAGHGEGRVLLLQPVQRRHELVVVGPRRRLDRHLERRRRQRRRRHDDGLALGGERVAGVGPVEAGDGHEVACRDGRRPERWRARRCSAARAAAPLPGCAR